MSATYCDVMKRKPIWRAVNFDWNFGSNEWVTYNPVPRISSERRNFEKMVTKLKFKIYPELNQGEKMQLTRNLSKKKFFEELRKFKRLCVEECCGCILVSVSSHGVIRKTSAQSGEEDVDTYEDYILTCPDDTSKSFSKDCVDECVTVRDIVEVFRDPDLKGIPKIFFIQACRSEDENPGETIKDSENTDLGIPFEVCDSEVINQGTGITGYIPRKPAENKIVYSPPCIDDSIIVFSTPLGYKAGFESARRGSHVWTELDKKLSNSPTPVKLLDLLKETNRELSQSEHHEVQNQDGERLKYKPLLSICYTLTKHIVFEK